MQSTRSCKNNRALLLFTSHPDKEVIRKGLRSYVESRNIYHHILLHLLSAITKAGKNTEFDIVIASDSGDDKNLDRVFKVLPICRSYRFIKHRKQYFGEKLTDALQQLKQWGYQQAVVIGNDCLELDADTITQSFDQLEAQQTVVGPAPDGGFYLLGLSEIRPELLSKIPWCTPEVLQALYTNLKANGITPMLLAERSDFDSFRVLKKILKQFVLDKLKLLYSQLISIFKSVKVKFENGLPFLTRWHILRVKLQLPPPFSFSA